MVIEWQFGKHKNFRRQLTLAEQRAIYHLEPGQKFQNQGEIHWLSVYLYEDGEYVVCLNQLGECYYEGSPDNERFKTNVQFRLENAGHVLLFLKNYILQDKYFEKTV